MAYFPTHCAIRPVFQPRLHFLPTANRKLRNSSFSISNRLILCSADSGLVFRLPRDNGVACRNSTSGRRPHQLAIEYLLAPCFLLSDFTLAPALCSARTSSFSDSEYRGIPFSLTLEKPPFVVFILRPEAFLFNVYFGWCGTLQSEEAGFLCCLNCAVQPYSA